MCGGQLGCNLPPASHSKREGVLRVIVSASYRTDIPAFYADWFVRRLAAGYCRVSNPYGGGDYEVLLTPEAVDGFVFWTRNMRPLLRHLDAIRRIAAFFVQFTLTGYPRALESSVIGVEEGVAQFRELRDRFGPRAAVWRYDPIVFAADLDAEAHCDGFARLAQALAGTIDDVVLSVMTPYKKTRRNLDRAARRHGSSGTIQASRKSRGCWRGSQRSPLITASPRPCAASRNCWFRGWERRAASMPNGWRILPSGRSRCARAAIGRAAAAPCRATSAPTTPARMAASTATPSPTATARLQIFGRTILPPIA